MKAHQRLIRETESAREPRAELSLDGAQVVRVSNEWASDIILRYEWLGTMNRAVICYGLLAACGTPLGVCCFGMPQGTNSRLLCGPEWRDRTIALERGACVHFAHPHAGSFLIARAVKLLAQDTPYRVIFAYSDEQAGEIGTIYQASNWLYLGVTGRDGRGRWKARRKDGDGKWQSSRMLRAQGYNGKEAWAKLRADPNWEFEIDKDKARYVTFAGSFKERRDARAALIYPPLPYPKRG